MIKLHRGKLGAADSALPFSNGHGGILQKFEPQIQTYGEWALLYFAGKLIFSIHKRAAKGEYRIQRQYGGLETVAKPPRAAQDLAKAAIAASI